MEGEDIFNRHTQTNQNLTYNTISGSSHSLRETIQSTRSNREIKKWNEI